MEEIDILFLVVNRYDDRNHLRPPGGFVAGRPDVRSGPKIRLPVSCGLSVLLVVLAADTLQRFRLENAYFPLHFRRRQHGYITGVYRLNGYNLAMIEKLLIVFDVVYQLNG